MTGFSFLLPQQQQDPTLQAGLQQYNQQGQTPDPGLAPAMQGGQAPALGAALQQLIQQQRQNGQNDQEQPSLGDRIGGQALSSFAQNAQNAIMQPVLGGITNNLLPWAKSLFGGSNG